ncbi:MAG: multiheme c-type cytochrome [Polyangiaceae bacterium]
MSPSPGIAAFLAYQALVPRPGDALAPALTELEGPVRGADIAEVDTCAQCHADVVSQWRASAHAFSSFNNPIYRAVVDGFRAETSPQTSKFCGGCHDLALLVDGAMDAPVAPQDERSHAGITCRTCHSIIHDRPDGNGSYTLTGAPIPFPAKGDRRGIEAHVARVAPAELRSFELCTGCHRAFLDRTTGNAHHLIGQDDVTPWQRSPYAGSELHLLDEELPQKDCRGCHMPQEDAVLGDVAATEGKVASHRFLGAHTWLAAIRGDTGTLSRTQDFLRGVASIDVAAVVSSRGERALPADGAVSERRSRWSWCPQQARGHRFPGGADGRTGRVGRGRDPRRDRRPPRRSRRRSRRHRRRSHRPPPALRDGRRRRKAHPGAPDEPFPRGCIQPHARPPRDRRRGGHVRRAGLSSAHRPPPLGAGAASPPDAQPASPEGGL